MAQDFQDGQNGPLTVPLTRDEVVQIAGSRMGFERLMHVGFGVLERLFTGAELYRGYTVERGEYFELCGIAQDGKDVTDVIVLIKCQWSHLLRGQEPVKAA